VKIIGAVFKPKGNKVSTYFCPFQDMLSNYLSYWYYPVCALPGYSALLLDLISGFASLPHQQICNLENTQALSGEGRSTEALSLFTPFIKTT